MHPPKFWSCRGLENVKNFVYTNNHTEEEKFLCFPQKHILSSFAGQKLSHIGDEL